VLHDFLMCSFSDNVYTGFLLLNVWGKIEEDDYTANDYKIEEGNVEDDYRTLFRDLLDKTQVFTNTSMKHT